MGPEISQGHNPASRRYTTACAVVASMVAVLMGYDTGVMSGAMLFIKEELKIKEVQVEVLAGILNIAALFGSLGAGKTSDIIGRRKTIILSSVIFFVGSILMGFAPNYGVLITGRCVAGFGVGFSLMIAPVYSAELASPSYRGGLTSLPEICIAIGILIGYISNYLFAKLPLIYGWRTMLGIAAVPSAALAAGVLFMPESPRWLVMQGRLADAKLVLSKVSETAEEAELRLKEIKNVAGIEEACEEDVVKPARQSRGEGVWKELLLRPTKSVRWMLLTVIGIHFFEHGIGIEAVVLYSPRILKAAGIHDRNKLLLATMGVGVTKAAFILVAVLFLDELGRRPLLLTSIAGAMVSLATIGAGLTAVEHQTHPAAWAVTLCIAGVLFYVSFFSIGMAPITWVYSAEVFPLRLRAQGHALGVAVNRLMNALISMTFISLYEAITIGGVFFMFSGISVLAWFFFFFCLPETKGKTLEEMDDLFARAASDIRTVRRGGGGRREDLELANIPRGL